MNKLAISLLRKIITILQKKYEQYTELPKMQPASYHSLSPISNADGGEYEEAMLWALKNRKKEDIKNVALTGPYGSGKSSILKTFQEKHKHAFNFLNISLATFKEELVGEEEEPKGGGVKPQDKDILRLIELSILQQIFYHEEDEKIPDSRFKKIRSFKKSNLIFIASSVLVLLICCFDLFSPNKFKSVFHLNLSANADLIVHLSALAVFITGTYIILLRSVRLVNSIKISKFKFNDAEIEIDEGISKSILNNHLDEILYFFEVTPYDIVIIEDLDRFQQTEIFTKLRELNLLINNSKKVKREIVFIYAVRDDMFQDKDRTKFFDFIVPVIPIINSSNSNEKLLDVIRENSYQVSDDLIDDISLFIDDMRLLYNITNEYHIYHNKLDKKLNQNKLLGMIVYKNIHPNDFVSLSNSKGTLYNVLDGRDVYIKSMIEQLDREIEAAKSEITAIDDVHIKDIIELRRLYIFEYLIKLPGITAFEVNSINYAFNAVLENSVFDYFIKNKVSYLSVTNNYGNYYQNRGPVTLQFADIEKVVDSNNTYAQREARIKSFMANKTESLKTKIVGLEQEKVKIRHFKFKDIIAAGYSKIELANGKQNLLVNILLRNGYIDEDYLDYISIFYEGSITKDDRHYLLNVKSQIALDFNFKLSKVEKLVAKIAASDFEKDYLYNYNLLDYLLNTPNQQSKLNALLGVIANQSPRSAAFIDGYIDNGKSIPIFIQRLSENWPSFWKYVNTQSALTKERKLEYYRLIMTHASIREITLLSSTSNLTAFTTAFPDFLTLLAEKEKIKKIIEALNVKFTQLILSHAPLDLVNFIYEGDYYALSTEMLKNILDAKEAYNEADFATQNYYSIQNSGQLKLVSYVDQNINEYVANVYLKLENNTNDPEVVLVKLLNNTNISIQNRTKIIERSSVKIKVVSNIQELDIQTALLIFSKLEPVWENILLCYHALGDEMDKALLGFMDAEANADVLSLGKVNQEVTGDELKRINNFFRKLVAEGSLTDVSYGKLIRAIPYTYPSVEFKDISAAKVIHLIDTCTLGITPENFTYLKTYFEGQQIMLLEKWHGEFVKKISDFNLEEADKIQLLASAAFSLPERLLIYQSLTLQEIVDSPNLSAAVGRLLIMNVDWAIDKNTLKQILTHSLSTSERIKLFNTRFRLFDRADVTAILSDLPYPYSDIAVLGKRPLLQFGAENGYLANNLKSLEYISKTENEPKGIRINTFKK